MSIATSASVEALGNLKFPIRTSANNGVILPGTIIRGNVLPSPSRNVTPLFRPIRCSQPEVTLSIFTLCRKLVRAFRKCDPCTPKMRLWEGTEHGVPEGKNHDNTNSPLSTFPVIVSQISSPSSFKFSHPHHLFRSKPSKRHTRGVAGQTSS